MPRLRSQLHTSAVVAPRETPRRGRFVVTYHRDGQLVGAVAVDSPRRLLHYRDLIGAAAAQPASAGRGPAVDLSTPDRAPLADRAAS